MRGAIHNTFGISLVWHVPLGSFLVRRPNLNANGRISLASSGPEWGSERYKCTLKVVGAHRRRPLFFSP